MSTWIKTSERLPEESVEVLTLSEDGIRVSYRDRLFLKYSFGWSPVRDACGCCDSYNPNVTHWMPLPEPPEGE